MLKDYQTKKGKRVTESYVPDVGVTEHGAADSLPVVLGILERRNRASARLATDGLACFRNPDRLSASSRPRSAQSGIKQRLALTDGVGHRVLEVRVCVHAEPI